MTGRKSGLGRRVAVGTSPLCEDLPSFLLQLMCESLRKLFGHNQGWNSKACRTKSQTQLHTYNSLTQLLWVVVSEEDPVLTAFMVTRSRLLTRSNRSFGLLVLLVIGYLAHSLRGYGPWQGRHGSSHGGVWDCFLFMSHGTRKQRWERKWSQAVDNQD